MYDDLSELGSVHRANSRNQEDSNWYQSAYNDIPKCPAVDFCQAAALRFNLPGCESQGERNEYLAFIIPKIKHEKKLPPKPVECRENYIQKERRPEHPPHKVGCRWDTEYRSTIDDCAKRLMSAHTRRKSPVCNKTSNPDTTRLSPLNSRPRRRDFSPVPLTGRSHIRRLPSPSKIKSDVKNYSRIEESRKPMITESFLNKATPCYESCNEKIQKSYDDITNRQSMCRCIPPEVTTRRPMTRCIHQMCD